MPTDGHCRRRAERASPGVPSPVCAASSDLNTRAWSFFQRPGQALKTLPSPAPSSPACPFPPRDPQAEAPRRRWPLTDLPLAGSIQVPGPYGSGPATESEGLSTKLETVNRSNLPVAGLAPAETAGFSS